MCGARCGVVFCCVCAIAPLSVQCARMPRPRRAPSAASLRSRGRCIRPRSLILLGVVLCIAILLVVEELPPVSVSPSQTHDDRGASWETRSSVPTERTEVTAAMLGGEIYVLGGFDRFGRTLDTVEVYDPATNMWRAGPSLPSPRHHAASAVIGLRLYVIGGFHGRSFRPMRDVFVFDRESEQWSPGSVLPEGRGAHVAAAEGGIIYVVGGITEEGVSAALLKLDSLTGEWEHLSPMPTPREHLAAELIADRLYVVGGRQGGLETNLGVLEVYDPATRAWSEGPSMPTARGGIAGSAVGDLFIVVGGEEPSRTFASAEAFDVGSQSWIALPPMPTARHGLGSATLGHRVFVIGGGRTPGLSVSGANEVMILQR